MHYFINILFFYDIFLLKYRLDWSYTDEYLITHFFHSIRAHSLIYHKVSPKNDEVLAQFLFCDQQIDLSLHFDMFNLTFFQIHLILREIILDHSNLFLIVLHFLFDKVDLLLRVSFLHQFFYLVFSITFSVCFNFSGVVYPLV